MCGPDGIRKSSKRKHKGTHFLPSLSKMKSIHNAVTDTLEELELEAYCIANVEEVRVAKYRVTFQERRNGNNKVVIEVEYCSGMNLASSRFLRVDEDAVDEWIEIEIVERHGLSEMTATLLYEGLAFQIDETHFDSDSELEDDSDDETLSLPSEPRTPPARSSQPLTPPPSRDRRA